MKLVLGFVLLINSVAAFSATKHPEFTFVTKEIAVTEADSQKMQSLMLNPIDPGTIISIAQGLVALGESVYNLVIKGKPTITTNMSPINVVPKDAARTYVDPMDLEDASEPIKRKFMMTAKNKLNQEVIKFEYMLIYQVATYEGKGKYILNAIILPQVKLGYGFDFTSTMKLIGVSNKGKKNDPIVRVILNVNYQIGSLMNRIERNDAITLDGTGLVKLN